MSQTTTKAGIRPANQPKSNQPKRQSELERFRNAPAIKCRVEMQASREDLILLNQAADLIDRWQRRDPENRFAFFTTSDACNDTTHSGGYHFERFFKGNKRKDEFPYLLFLASNFIADEELRAGLSFIADYVKENADRLMGEWKEQLTT